MKKLLAFVLFFPFTSFCMNIPQEARGDLLNIARQDCSICYDQMIDGLVITECNHLFHQRCIYQWLEQSGLCPICRANVNDTRPTTALEQIISALGGSSSQTVSSREPDRQSRRSTAENSSRATQHDDGRSHATSSSQTTASSSSAINRHSNVSETMTMGEYIATAMQQARNQYPLHHAAGDGNEELVDRLLFSGVPVDQRNLAGFTPLMFAAKEGHLNIINLLLRKGANANAQQCYGFPPLSVAVLAHDEPHKALCSSGVCLHGEVINRLLVAGANINAKHNDGKTALTMAVECCNTSMVLWLLDARANPNVVDEEGNTPLHISVSKFYRPVKYEIVELLLAYGANHNATDKSGWTALQNAEVYLKDQKIIQLLKNAQHRR